MYVIKVSSNPNLGKGHINRCLRIRKKIKSEVKWFVDKGTRKLFFDNINDEVYEEENDNSFDKLEKISAKNNIKAIIRAKRKRGNIIFTFIQSMITNGDYFN